MKFFLRSLAFAVALFLPAASSLAVDYDKLVGYWANGSAEVIEVRRSGAEAVCHMRSTRGLKSWTNGTIVIKGEAIHLTKRNNTKIVNEQTGTYRKDGVAKIRWSENNVWKKITDAEAKEMLKKG